MSACKYSPTQNAAVIFSCGYHSKPLNINFSLRQPCKLAKLFTANPKPCWEILDFHIYRGQVVIFAAYGADSEAECFVLHGDGTFCSEELIHLCFVRDLGASGLQPAFLDHRSSCFVRRMRLLTGRMGVGIAWHWAQYSGKHSVVCACVRLCKRGACVGACVCV